MWLCLRLCDTVKRAAVLLVVLDATRLVGLLPAWLQSDRPWLQAVVPARCWARPSAAPEMLLCR